MLSHNTEYWIQLKEIRLSDLGLQPGIYRVGQVIQKDKQAAGRCHFFACAGPPCIYATYVPFGDELLDLTPGILLFS
jgi:hypothetical protein